MKITLFALSILLAAPEGMAQKWILGKVTESCDDVCGVSSTCDASAMEAVDDQTKAQYVFQSVLQVECSVIKRGGGGVTPFVKAFDTECNYYGPPGSPRPTCTGSSPNFLLACCCIPNGAAGTCSVDASAGGAGGDPHFKTWTGKKFDFHGECDLVLVDHPEFANGTGMKLQIRTTRDRYFSYIERAALQIGPDVLEFGGSKDWTINGKDLSSERMAMLGGYEVWVFPKALSVRLDKAAKAKIDFISRKSGTPYVLVDGSTTDLFNGSLGMMGDSVTGNMMMRDGVTMEESPVKFAREWQVNPSFEPNLFQAERSPVYPEWCKMPEVGAASRLGSTHMEKAAEQACESWGDDKDECVFDVMATRDIRAAQSLGSTNWNRAAKHGEEMHDEDIQ